MPMLKPIAKADSVVRLFTNALNPLAHTGHGLDAAIEIVSRVHCFELLSSQLPETCELITSTFVAALSTSKNRTPIIPNSRLNMLMNASQVLG